MSGFLLISDITGYTMYLSQSELEHAREVLTALLELLVEHTKPPLVISRLAGDAVISYAIRGAHLQGQTFVEIIETTYVAFRRAIELMVLNNTCRCNACANIATLDLKFFIHHGEFMLQRVGGREELVGNDVNLIHRLLKNRVTEATGIRAYTLYTAAAVGQLGLEAFCEKLLPHREAYEHLGEVTLWVQDMHPLWEEARAAAATPLPPEQIQLRVESEIAAPPHIVWDYLSRIEYRSTLVGADRMTVLDRKAGRVAPGTVIQCYHGDQLIPQTITRWIPFAQMTTENVFPRPDSRITVELLLADSAKGTRLTVSISKTRGPLLGRRLGDHLVSQMAAGAQKDVDAFREQVEQDIEGKNEE